MIVLLSVLICKAEMPRYRLIDCGNLPTPTYGSIQRYTVESKSLNAEVTVDVWLPDDIDTVASYPVVYMHDGQNLFDPNFAFAGVAWEVDKACMNLARDNDFNMPIVVGINNRGSEGLRVNDYFPEKVLNFIADDMRSKTKIYDTCSNNFLGDEEARFVATELKPLIDELYTTDPSPQSTFAMGSSLGADAALYLMCEYPDVFGGAACMSTHWIGSLDLNSDYSMNDDEVCATAILDYMDAVLPSPHIHRLYLDQGTTGWDAGYLKYETQARAIALRHGYSTADHSFMTHDAAGAGHNEWYWQQRVEIPLQFLLSKKGDSSSGIGKISCDSPTQHENIIYDIYGRSYPSGQISSLAPGFYIVNGRKFVKHADRFRL